MSMRVTSFAGGCPCKRCQNGKRPGEGKRLRVLQRRLNTRRGKNGDK
jgi:hypothetical protein